MVKAKLDSLIAARFAEGLNKLALAQMCGLNHATIIKIEQGAGTSPKTAKKIADALGKPIEELFSYTGSRLAAERQEGESHE